MNISVEQLEGHMAKLTIEVEADLVEKAIEAAYKKQRNSINVPGFRKGKAPRVLIEKMYGVGVFYEEAANRLIDEQYPKAYDESDVDIVSRPEIEIVQMESGKPFIFTAEVATRPPVELGKYIGVTVTKADVSVSDDDVEVEIDRIRGMNSRRVEVKDRPVQDKDIVNIDYSGKCEGKVFDGGTAKGQNLMIGSNSFIPGFESQVIGHSIGEEFDIDVTFPEEYHSAELAGKPAVFTVKINEIHMDDLPAFTQEYVQDISEFDTIDEYKADIRAKLTERKENMARRAKEEEAIEKIVDSSKMDIPEPMIETQVDSMMNEFARSMQMQGIPFQQYLAMTGMSAEAMRVQMRADAEKQVRTSLVLEEIAKVEKFEATDEEVEKKAEEMGAMYMIDVKDMLEALTDDDRKRIKKDIQVEKAVALIGDNVKERAKPKKKDAEESEGEEKPKKTRKTTKKDKED